MAIRATEAKRGMVIRHEGELFQIEKYHHVAPGNWRAINHLLLRNLKTGKQKELRLGSGDMLEQVFVDNKQAQYLYRDSIGHVFMDNESYEQFHLSEEVLSDAMKYIQEGDNIDVAFIDGAATSVQLPASVSLEVVEAEEAVKGDTVSNIQKLAKLKTGLELKVPVHIKVGERVKVNTETGEFMGRAND
jgi:elongation factor P